MPQYLAIEYFQLALAETRSNVSSRLLTVPTHLEKVGEYLHHGVIQSTHYRTPWKRSKLFEVISDNEDFFLSEKIYMKSNPLEPYEISNKSGSFRPECNDPYEIVPSSNPSSQNSIDDETLAKLCDLQAENNGYEMFEKFTDTSNDQYFEDIISSLSKENTPPIDKLLGRLKPLAVKDPLLSNEGKIIKENGRENYDGNGSVRKTDFYSPVGCGEIVLKEKVKDKDVEEFLYMSNTVEYNGIEKNKEFKVSYLINQMKEENLPETDINKGISSLLEEKSEAVKIENIRFNEPVVQKTASFIDLNSKGIDSILQPKECVLESPIFEKNCIEKMPIKSELWKELKPFNMTDKDIIPNIVSPKSLKAFQMTFWSQEKYFDEVLALRLKEPSLNKLASNIDITACGCAKLLLIQSNPFEKHGLDLELQWDPFQNAIYRRTVEALYEYEKTQIKNQGTVEETFEKELKLTDDESIRNEELSYQSSEYQKESTGLISNHIENPVCYKTPQKSASKLVSEKIRSKNAGEVKVIKDLETPISRPKYSPIGISTPMPFDDVQIFLSMRASKKARESKEKRLNDRSHKDNEKANFTKEIVETTPSNLTTTREKTPKQASVQSEQIKPAVETTMKNKKTKSNVISVKLDDAHLRILHQLKSLSECSIRHLSSQRLLPSTQNFFALKPDVTRFILKQHQRSQQDKFSQEKNNDYFSVVMLHILVSCADILVNCCLQAMIHHLASMQENFTDVIKGELQSFHQQLFMCHHSLQQKKIDHPAIVTMCDHLSNWLARKKIKSPGHDPKVLILVHREIPVLCEVLAEAVSPCAKADYFVGNVNQILSPHEICQRLDNHSCLVLMTSQITPTFPWAQFSMIVSYEHLENAKWKEICERQNIRYLGIAVEKVTETISDDINTMSASENNLSLTLIGSQKLAQNFELLQLLEGRYNLLIQVPPDSSENEPDVTLNASTCVLLVCLQDKSTNDIAEKVVTRISKLLLKFSKIFVLVHEAFNGTQNYLFSGESVNALTKLHASIPALCGLLEGSSVKVLITGSSVNTASMMRQLAERYASFIQMNEEDEILKHGRFLSSFPCLNQLSAKMILNKMSIKELASCDLQELIDNFPSISQTQIHLLWKLFTYDQSIYGITPSNNDSPENTHNTLHQSPTKDEHSHMRNTHQYKPQDDYYHSPNTDQCYDRESMSINYDNLREESGSINYDHPREKSRSIEYDRSKYEVTSPLSLNASPELPDLVLSQPNEFAQAERQLQLETSLFDDSFECLELNKKLGNSNAYMKQDMNKNPLYGYQYENDQLRTKNFGRVSNEYMGENSTRCENRTNMHGISYFSDQRQSNSYITEPAKDQENIRKAHQGYHFKGEGRKDIPYMDRRNKDNYIRTEPTLGHQYYPYKENLMYGNQYLDRNYSNIPRNQSEYSQGNVFPIQQNKHDRFEDYKQQYYQQMAPEDFEDEYHRNLSPQRTVSNYHNSKTQHNSHQRTRQYNIGQYRNIGMYSPKELTRPTPSIAPVTPNVRKQSWISAKTEQDLSPPMDLSSDEENQQGIAHPRSSLFTHYGSNNTAIGSYPQGSSTTSAKKRKLTYEKVPGRKNGQTRLSFK